jgi:hypothetical protein
MYIMDQKWNKDIKLKPEIVKQSKAIKPLDILVGVLCKDVETTVLNVLNVVNDGLYSYYPDLKKAIVVSQGASTDDTDEAIGLFQPNNDIPMIVTKDITDAGKGAGIRTILEIAHHTQAKCVILIDGDLLSIKPEWIRAISTPIVFGIADLTVPYYIRDKYDGVITNNLVYPFTRAVYGINVRQPIAGEFGLSKQLYEKLRKHPMFPPNFGVDIFIVTVAAANKMEIKEGLFALKIHRSTRRYIEPEKFLIPMFRSVTGSMLELAKYYEDIWKKREPSIHNLRFNGHIGRKPIPVKIDVKDLNKNFIKELKEIHDNLFNYLSKKTLKSLNTNIENGNIDSELWSKIVYEFAASYKNIKTSKDKKLLIDALKTLWIGRFASYTKETKDMNLNQAEQVIQKQAQIFEHNFDYFKIIY